MLDFMEPPNPWGMPSAWGTRAIQPPITMNSLSSRPWEEVVDLVYHPGIPSYLTAPSSVRRSHWVEINGLPQPFPRLAGQVTSIDHPFIIKGIEFIENSPDTNSGSYYAYNLDRALIFLTHNHRRVLISISVQPDKSQVGKKGMIMGPDEDWNYLYTGIKGSTMRGLGWVDTYMYSSASIMVYYESAAPQKQIQCGVFKWIDAGWSGMNFAQSTYIRKGVERFAKDFQQIIEFPHLPDNDALAQMFQKINELPTDELKAKCSTYFDQLRGRYQNQGSRYDKWFSKLFKDQTYLESLNRQEMQALVSIEYLKYLMGKPHRFDASYFNTSLSEKKPS